MSESRTRELFSILRDRQFVGHGSLEQRRAVFERLSHQFPAMAWYDFAAELRMLETALEQASEEAERMRQGEASHEEAVDRLRRRFPKLDREMIEALLSAGLMSTR